MKALKFFFSCVLIALAFTSCNNAEEPKDPRDEIVGRYSYNMVSNSTYTTAAGTDNITNSDSGYATIVKHPRITNGITLVIDNTEYPGEYHNGQIFINSRTEVESGYLEGIYTTITASMSFTPATFRNNTFSLNANAILVLRAGASTANGVGRIQFHFMKN